MTYRIAIAASVSAAAISFASISYAEPICGLVEFVESQSDRDVYEGVANGQIWVNTSDSNGTITSRAKLTVVPGNLITLFDDQGFSCA